MIPPYFCYRFYQILQCADYEKKNTCKELFVAVCSEELSSISATRHARSSIAISPANR